MIFANLVKKEWLKRYFNVMTHEGVFEVVYNGTGMGYEEVLVNNETVNRKKSFLWYVPKFDFMIGNTRAQINVKVSFLLQISAFSLVIDDIVVYSE